jgi:hypothetical protein
VPHGGVPTTARAPTEQLAATTGAGASRACFHGRAGTAGEVVAHSEGGRDGCADVSGARRWATTCVGESRRVCHPARWPAHVHWRSHARCQMRLGACGCVCACVCVCVAPEARERLCLDLDVHARIVGGVRAVSLDVWLAKRTWMSALLRGWHAQYRSMPVVSCVWLSTTTCTSVNGHDA